MSVNDVVGFLIIVAIIAFIYLRSSMKEDEKKAVREKEEDLQEKWLKQNAVTLDVDYTYRSKTSAIYVRYIVDLNKRKIYTSNSQPYFTALPFSEINGFEILEDSAVVGGVGRAVAGGIIAGEMGAIIGATTAKEHLLSLQAIIYTKNIRNPQIILTLIKVRTDKNTDDYKNIWTFTNRLNASIKAIMTDEKEPRNLHGDNAEDVFMPLQNVASTNLSEIMKLTGNDLIKAIRLYRDETGASLKDAKVIVEEEFKRQGLR